ncbi:MAG: TlpA disulfide reductase family protein [Myxococcota bacterium]
MNVVRAAVLAGIGGCIPHLYSEDYSEVDTGPWSWTAPVNTWPLAEPPVGTEAEGYEPGQVVPDVRLIDQFGDEVSMWQFYGQVILLDVSTMWCAPCQDLGLHTEQNWQEYRDRGFVYVTVLQQDVEGDPTELVDVNEWVDTFAITAPVLADPDAETYGAIQNDTFPTVLVVGRDLKVIERLGTTDEELRAAIEAAL